MKKSAANSFAGVSNFQCKFSLRRWAAFKIPVLGEHDKEYDRSSYVQADTVSGVMYAYGAGISNFVSYVKKHVYNRKFFCRNVVKIERSHIVNSHSLNFAN